MAARRRTRTPARPLTDRQRQAMRRHAQHHTKRHMDEMTRLMRAGSTFTEAHRKAMSKVGR